ncbi:MAG TPA: universal stress protein [Candidatus Dormibacteraeota bacterium]|nr:universal stress protein [Candidatus Dormibacteraeota bacterium]
MERDQHSPRIVIGLDGSPGSTHALQWAIDLAKRLGAEIVAVHVDSLPIYVPAPMGIVPPAETPQQRADLQEAFSTEWCLPLRRSGVRYRATIEESTPTGTALIEVALREGADMIVVGSRGLNAVTEFLLGSVSHQVAHHSPIPVVIVPPAVRVKAGAKPRYAEVRQPALLPVP